MKLSNWGNYPLVDAEVKRFSTVNELQNILADPGSIIPRGLGRSYGDSSLNRTVVSALKFNRLLSFAESSGTLTCEAGVSLAEILAVFVPRGWFLPVTPGTKFVTVGGAIASDVHGKNHHKAGAFSNHISSLDVLLSTGEVITCSRTDNSELFWATCGGMGLTGIILRAAFNLIPIETAFIKQEIERAENLDGAMEVFESSGAYAYSVAWIDCLSKGASMGRSVMIRGAHAEKGDLTLSAHLREPLKPPDRKKLDMPFYLPERVLNSYSVRAFNYFYYHKSPARVRKSITGYDTFFYPLDAVTRWNRIYGRKGFIQYQAVLPKETSMSGLKKILARISGSRRGSFLAVLKLLGKQDDMLSFPLEGYTLALDFPVENSLFGFLDELDNIVLEYGGRLYLAKDARMGRRVFDGGYKNADRFRELKHKFDMGNKFQSLQSKRIGI